MTKLRTVAALLATAVVLGAAGCVSRPSATDLPIAQLTGPRLLVIAPHPDDETLAAGGAIAVAREKGWKVTIVVITCGDAFKPAESMNAGAPPTPAERQARGVLRHNECLRATAALGVPAKDVVFLGYPDGSTYRLLRENWDSDKPRTGMNGASRVPYSFAYRPGAGYTGTDLASQLEQIIREHRPTTILYPDSNDHHQDHWAAAGFTQIALARTGYKGSSLTYLVHRKGFPVPLGFHPSKGINPPPSLRIARKTWFTSPLTPSVETTKRGAFDAYVSQIEADRRLISSFIRTNELFARDDPATLSAGSTTTFAEAAGDNPLLADPASADIDEIVISSTGTVVTLSVSTVSALSSRATFMLHVQALDSKGRSTFYDVSVIGSTMKTLYPSSASLAGSDAPELRRGDVIRIRLPDRLMEDADWLLMGADVSLGGRLVDHAAWHLVRVER